MIGGDRKIVATDPDGCKHKVYDLGTDPAETADHLPNRPYRDGFVEGGSDCLVCNRCRRVLSARTAWAATSTRGNHNPAGG